MMLHNLLQRQAESKNLINDNLIKNISGIRHQNNISEFVSCVDKIHQLQNQNQLQNLILLLGYVFSIYQKSLSFKSQTALVGTQSKQCDRAQIQSITKQSQDIKTRNNKFLRRILNLRVKMVGQMYMHKTSSRKYETDINFLQQQIRQCRMRITNKCNRLYFMKLNQHQRLFKQQYKEPCFYDAIMKQFKKATQILQKETLKTKLQLGMFIQQYKGLLRVNDDK